MLVIISILASPGSVSLRISPADTHPSRAKIGRAGDPGLPLTPGSLTPAKRLKVTISYLPMFNKSTR
jgi:hypothetical protein